MTDTTPDSQRGFPWWVVGGAALLAAAYLPTLATPFDFLDDGNLVYPTRGWSLGGHVWLWWDKVTANVEHLGPFRPTLWAHWELFSNAFDEDPVLWRLHRVLWCGLSAGLFLWLLRELKIHPVAALLAGAIGMWNPYRNEVWLSLTLAEGVAMPYAVLALIAARRGAHAAKPWRWDIAAVVCVLMALGCKNTFAALLPAMVMLRMWPDGMSLREAWRRNGVRALMLTATLALPIGHFVYFKLHWHEGQYHTTGPTLGQAVRMLASLKGAIGLDFVGAGLGLAALAVWVGRKASPGTEVPGQYRPAILTGVLLLLAGFAAYLPVDIISGRYTMPAAWGLDILVGVLLTALLNVPKSALTRLAWAGVAVGLALTMVALVGKEEKFAARANVLWDAVHYVEQAAPRDARVAWIDGDPLRGELDAEEGIHFRWHLLHRGRGDVKIGLFDSSGKPIPRIEHPILEGEPDFRIGCPPTESGWHEEHAFGRIYWFGRRRYAFHLDRKLDTPTQAGVNMMFNDICRRELLGESQPPAGLVAGPSSLEFYFPDPAQK